ncbi:6-hydroxymethylpterin diphosphokinase MptE-like protein [Rubellicoccus peritrichatus]|uniref:6-hydroxymethylpterin diphosphokinase MptE-like protein n=1 Tax=Rubellicoccus peritrichatus TaxID=3080537 RepID=A0AAQ3QXF2_9BACT|nr:6-hydroxymethylpterin diphosphokinase MptE-like protein [Puniceicoccus sp. CR14]WOO43007.1 6-hydroxymethylpterin diphosphokinase MptE-like protein [Puniceicoccus sp. CR14]
MAQIQERGAAHVMVIFTNREDDVTLRAVEAIAVQLRDGDTIGVLLNGGRRPDMESLFGRIPAISYYEVDENLGVAGGRNYLMDKPEAAAATYNLFVDNDAMAPMGYVDGMCDYLESHPEVGVAGATVLAYNKIKDILESRFPVYQAVLGADIYHVSNADLYALQEELPYAEILDHVGTSSDYRKGYFQDLHLLDRIINSSEIGAFEPFVHSLKETDILDDADVKKRGFFRVSNIAGCTYSFRRDLINKIGIFDDRFNNYGYEDAEFSIRSIKHGYENRTLTRVFLIHGLDSRHRKRLSSEARMKFRINHGRALSHLLEKHRTLLDSKDSRWIVRRGLDNWSRNTGNSWEEVYYGLIGSRWAECETSNTSCCEEIALATNKTANQQTDQRLLALRNTERIRDLQVTVSCGLNVPDKSVEVPTPDFSQLVRFKDMHKGERCFIIGNGPSLNQIDLGLLSREVTFGVNGIFYMTRRSGFKPTYHVIEDNHVVEDNLEAIRAFRPQARFLPEKYAELIGDSDETFYLPADWGFYYKNHPYYETPRFSEDITKAIYVGQSVTYLNIQLAYYMGFSEIYLVGMDFSYEIPSRAKTQVFSITSDSDDPNHFHPDYFGKGKKWHFPKLYNCYKVYSFANEYIHARGRKIENATIGGKLEAFPRADIKNLFGEEWLGLASPNAPLTDYVRCVLQKLPLEERLNYSIEIDVGLDADSILFSDLKLLCKYYNVREPRRTKLADRQSSGGDIADLFIANSLKGAFQNKTFAKSTIVDVDKGLDSEEFMVGLRQVVRSSKFFLVLRHSVLLVSQDPDLQSENSQLIDEINTHGRVLRPHYLMQLYEENLIPSEGYLKVVGFQKFLEPSVNPSRSESKVLRNFREALMKLARPSLGCERLFYLQDNTIYIANI